MPHKKNKDVSPKDIKEAIALQIAHEMAVQDISKAELARRMETSPAQIDRILDPGYEGINLTTLIKAASAVGKQLKIGLS